MAASQTYADIFKKQFSLALTQPQMPQLLANLHENDQQLSLTTIWIS